MKNNSLKLKLITCITVIPLLFLSSCGINNNVSTNNIQNDRGLTEEQTQSAQTGASAVINENISISSSTEAESANDSEPKGSDTDKSSADLSSAIPDYSDEAVCIVNNNVPFFTQEEISNAAQSYEYYSDLDRYGRCGYAMASVSEETMPSEERGDISDIHPTGWWGLKESSISPERCHLIAFMLTGENDNARNLVTGTHQMNVTGGMLKYESQVDDLIEDNGGHVLYRVTPDFRSDDELCRGVLMEAESVEDKGASLLFCVYVYNAQKDWTIDYSIASAEYEGEDTNVIDDTAYGGQ